MFIVILILYLYGEIFKTRDFLTHPLRIASHVIVIPKNFVLAKLFSEIKTHARAGEVGEKNF
jgi:hypothetical protein